MQTELPIKYSYEVTENFFAGGYPFAKETEEGIEKLKRLTDFGIKHFIDLTSEPLTKYSEFLPEDCTYKNLPTEDDTVPHFGFLKEAHDIISQSNDEEEKVYVHCKGGYDRTGVVVATYFIYVGFTPEEAKEQFLKVSKPVQGRYLHKPLIETNWKVLEEYQEWLAYRNIQLDPSPLHISKKNLLRGGILGLAVADALGVPVEFHSRESLRRNPVTDMRGYGMHNQPPGTWSDDTSLTLALLDYLTYKTNEVNYYREKWNTEREKRIAKRIATKKAKTPEEIWEAKMEALGEQTKVEFRRRQPYYPYLMQWFCSWIHDGEYTAHGEVFDFGVTTREAIDRYEGGTKPLRCGGTSEQDNGNGSLMRILPTIFYLVSFFGGSKSFFGDNEKEYIDIIHKVSSLTHAHKRSRIACGLYLSIAGEIFEVFFDEKYRRVKYAIRHGLKEAKEYYKSKKGYAKELKHYKRLFRKDFAKLPEEEIKSGGYVVDTLEAAIWCLLNTKNYKDCVLKAVNLGGDTDTVAAIAGGLAGMFYGVDDIPAEWLEQLARRDYIEKLCEEFGIAHFGSWYEMGL
jgi:ADP-ribosylglycohydrolase/protein-tyrosine phosphatase